MNDGNLNQFLYFSHSFDLNSSIHHFFHDLRYFDNLLDNSGYNNNLFHNLLYFNDFRYFDHLFNDLIDVYTNFFDSFDSSRNLDNLFNNDLNRVVLCDEVINWFFNLDDFLHLDYFFNLLYNLDDFRNLSTFNNDLSDNFRNSDNFFLDDRYFNSSVDNFFNLFYHGNWMIHDSFNFFYSISVDYFLLNNFNFFYSRYFNLNLNYLFNYLGNFNDFLNSLNDGDRYFYNNFDNFRHSDRLVDYFSSTFEFSNFHRFFNDTIEGFNNLNNSFNNFLLNFFYFYNFSNDFLYSDNFFLDYFNFLDLRDSMVDDFLNNDWFFNLYYLFLDYFDFHNLGNFYHSLNNLFDNSWYFNYLFGVLRNFDNFLDNVINCLNNLDRNMDDLLNLLNFHNFHGSFNNSFYRDNLRNFNHSIHNFLDYLFYFNDLGNHSKDFQDIININNSHDFSIDHTNDSFINIQHKSTFSFQFLKFFKESLYQHSQMEFYFSCFFTTVSIDIFDSVDFRDIFYDFNNSFKVINFDEIDQFLTEKFSEPSITLFS